MNTSYSKKIKDTKALNTIMAGLFPNRCDCVVFFDLNLDITNLFEYIKTRRKTNPDMNINFFYCFVAACVRLLYERPLLNTYVKNLNFYERLNKSISFIVKKDFSDEGEEAVVFYESKSSDNIDDVCKLLNDEIYSLKKNMDEKLNQNNKANDNIDFFAKLPKPILKFAIFLTKILDKHNCVPASLRAGDTNFSSILIANLGSIDLDPCFHHLNNYGANSFVIMIGKINKSNDQNTKVPNDKKSTVHIRITLDERIADGYYFSKSFKVLQYLLDNPHLLEIPFKDSVSIDC